MVLCAIAGCSNRSDKNIDNGFSFFRFPKDPKIMAVWVHRCARGDKFDVKTAVLCSAHFSQEAYDTSYLIKKSLMGSRRTSGRMLHEEAMPTLNLPSSILSRPVKDRIARRERSARRERKELVERLLAGLPDPAEEAIKWPDLGDQLKPTRKGSKFDDTSFEKKNAKKSSSKSTAGKTSSGAPGVAPSGLASAPADSAAEPEDGSPLSSSDEDAPGGPSPTLPAESLARKLQKFAKSNPTVARSLQLLKQRARVRRLEIRCLHVLGVRGFGRGRSGDPETVAAALDMTNVEAEAEKGGDAENAAESGNAPLIVLRKESRQPLHLPKIVTTLHQSQVPDELMSTTPSNLQEALEQNHNLKMQSLVMQEAVLQWAIKDKQMRDSRSMFLRKKKESKVVRGARLKELENLEAALKSIFTQGQIRALVRRFQRREGKLVTWSEEDIRRTLELRAISSNKVVDHVRLQMNIPLPGMKLVKKRCMKNTELKELFMSAMERATANEKLCSMCQRGVDTVDEVVAAVASVQTPEQDFSWQPAPAPPPPLGRRGRGGKTPKSSQRLTPSGKRLPPGGKRPPPARDHSPDSTDSEPEYRYTPALGEWAPKAAGGKTRGGGTGRGRGRQRGAKTGPPGGSPRKKARKMASPEPRWSEVSDTESDDMDQGMWGHVPEISHWRGSSGTYQTNEYRHPRQSWN